MGDEDAQRHGDVSARRLPAPAKLACSSVSGLHHTSLRCCCIGWQALLLLHELVIAAHSAARSLLASTRSLVRVHPRHLHSTGAGRWMNCICCGRQASVAQLCVVLAVRLLLLSAFLQPVIGPACSCFNCCLLELPWQ